MASLHEAGYDVEWHIVVLGKVAHKERYASLAAATGGSFLAVESFDENSREADAFLDAIDSSSRGDADERRRRQQQYQIDARRGNAERFEWFKMLGDGTKKG